MTDPEDETLLGLIEELAKVREEIKASRKKIRSNRIDNSELKNKAAILREQIKANSKERKEKRKITAANNKYLLDQYELDRREASKKAMTASGLYWANYNKVRMDYEEARRKVFKLGAELKFHRFTGEGSINVQFQKGLPTEDVFREGTILQILEVPEYSWDKSRAERKRLTQTKVKFRVTSDNRKPVWAEFSMVLHRPLPEGESIKSAAVIRKKVGRKWRYSLHITVTIESQLKIHGKGIIALDMGWRKVDEGLRVGYWVNVDGDHDQLVLNNSILAEFEKCNDLRSIRDNHFNEIKEKIKLWSKENEKPDWLAEDIKFLSKWKSQGKLVSIVNKWRENRFDGDNDIFTLINYWREREFHLYDWESNLRDQVIKRRREIYRVFASELVKKYGVIIIEDIDLINLAKKVDPEHGPKISIKADSNRFIASIGILIKSIEDACKRSGADKITVDAVNTTRICNNCSFLNDKSSVKLFLTCEKCGNTYDQDFNAAKNILKRGLIEVEVKSI